MRGWIAEARAYAGIAGHFTRNAVPEHVFTTSLAMRAIAGAVDGPPPCDSSGPLLPRGRTARERAIC